MTAEMRGVAEHDPVLIVCHRVEHHDSDHLRELRINGGIVRGTLQNYQKLLHLWEFGLVLLDWRNNDSTVLHTCRDIRAISDQPLILVTGLDHEEFVLGAYDVGVSECVVRPIGSQLLGAKIQAWLRWTI